MGRPPPRRARAFGPGHVTGAFRPETSARDPRARGSVGIGVVLGVGATAVAEWRPARRARLSVRSDPPGPLPISTEVARRLLSTNPGELRVRIEHRLPVGQGFGMSAAGAIATGLAVARVVGAPRRRAVEVAHLAELFGGGGLGGVAAILGGGVEARRRPGIPPFGTIVHRPFADPVLLVVVGPPVPSPSVLGRPARLAEIAAAYDRVADLARRPSSEAFWEASERFTDRLGWSRPELRATVRGIRRRGGRAAQTMFGQCVVARLPVGRRASELVRWLAQRELPAVELGADPRGARGLPAPRAR